MNIQIETSRLILRLPALQDLDPWAEMMTDEETAKFIGGVMARSVTWRALMTLIGSWHANGFAMFSVIEKSSGRWVGRLGPWMPDGWPGTEVGWAIVRDCWGKGYATEGAIAATDWAFDNLGWTDVIHSIAPANIASQQVARRLGSRNRGRGALPAPFQDSVIDIWGQSREEWRARRSTATA
jgi:RimJ/RimL family protein N-acetyltransferase